MDGNTGNYPATIPANLMLATPTGIGAAVNVTAAPGQTVLTVGAGEEFKTIGAAIAAAVNGDLILVAPGTYINDFADVTAQVTIAGAGGIATLIATEAPTNEKGIFVVDANCTIENLSFQGAAIPDSEGGNAAGIRYQGGNLVLNNDSFIGNQNGILAAAVDGLAQNTVTITNSTFDSNGQSSGPNSGYTHNAYISNGISSLVATGNVFERAEVGHELKSRAATNLIAGNVFYDGPTGTASYSIDLPNGGADTVCGNVIEKGPMAENSAIIHFGGEGIPYAGSTLDVSDNRIVNDLGPQAIAVLNQTTLNVNITGNEFDNLLASNIGSGIFAESGNWDQTGAAIASNSSTQFAPGTDIDDFSGDATSHAVTLTSSMGVRGGGGVLSVFADAGHVTVLGGAGGLNYQEQAGWGGSYIATAAGASDTVVALAQDVIDSEGNDSIVGGSGNLWVQVGGHAIIASGGNDNAYIINGAASITGSGGSDTVQLNSAAAQATVGGAESYFQSTVNGGALAFAITQGGAPEQATVIGAAALQVYNGATNITTAGGTGGTVIDFGAGAVTACFSNGADTIFAGSGTENIIVTQSAQIHAGAGMLSVFGRGESGVATVYGAHGTVAIGGDSGGILFVGGAQASTVQASLANITVQGGAGLLNVSGGSCQTVTGGAGGLIFNSAGGGDIISTQASASDVISVQGASVINSAGTDTIYAGGNATVTASGHASIVGSAANAFYVLNGQESLAANGYTRATVGGGASDTVTSAGSLTCIEIQGGRLAFSETGNTDHEAATIVGAGASLVASSAASLTTISLTAKGSHANLGGGHISVAASGGTQISAGSGHDTVSLSGGGVVVHGGAGALTLNLNDWSDQAVTTVFGGAGAITQASGYGNLIFVGGTGAATLGGVSGGETVAAGAGNTSLTGGNGGTNFAAYTGHGGGNAQVALTSAGGHITFGTGTTSVVEAGYGQSVLFDFAAGSGGGTDIITGFRAGVDQLVFQGVTVTQENTVAGNSALLLSDGTQVTLMGISSTTTNSLHLMSGH